MKNTLTLLLCTLFVLPIGKPAFAQPPADQPSLEDQKLFELIESRRQIGLLKNQIEQAQREKKTALEIAIPITLAATLLSSVTAMEADTAPRGEDFRPFYMSTAVKSGAFALGSAGGMAYFIHVRNEDLAQWDAKLKHEEEVETAALEELKKSGIQLPVVDKRAGQR